MLNYDRALGNMLTSRKKKLFATKHVHVVCPVAASTLARGLNH
jgi:hypothetical protein